MTPTEPQETPHNQVDVPVQFLFAMGELSGTVRSLQRSVDAIPGTLSSINERVRILEDANAKRLGQNSVLTVAISAIVSLIVGVAIYVLTRGVA